jgi:hypothetical protein
VKERIKERKEEEKQNMNQLFPPQQPPPVPLLGCGSGKVGFRSWNRSGSLVCFII